MGEKHTAIFGLVLTLWLTRYPKDTFFGEGDWGNAVGSIHSQFKSSQPGKAILSILVFLILSSAIAFQLMTVMSSNPSQRKLWTAIAGYCLIAYGCCYPFRFCWLWGFPSSSRGIMITSTLFDALIWILIGIWHVVVGHGCCPEEDEEKGIEQNEAGQPSGCCGPKPRYDQPPFYPGYGAPSGQRPYQGFQQPPQAPMQPSQAGSHGSAPGFSRQGSQYSQQGSQAPAQSRQLVLTPSQGPVQL